MIRFPESDMLDLLKKRQLLSAQQDFIPVPVIK